MAEHLSSDLQISSRLCGLISQGKEEADVLIRSKVDGCGCGGFDQSGRESFVKASESFLGDQIDDAVTKSLVVDRLTKSHPACFPAGNLGKYLSIHKYIF